MKTSKQIYLLERLSEFNVRGIASKLALLSLLLICSTNIFAQQKVVSQDEWQLKLTEVNENIQKIDQLTASINTRIAGVPSENVDPSVYVRLNDLQIKRDQYSREKISIEAVLNSAQNFSPAPQIKEISMATFLSLPKENQEQILAHPEQYKVIESK